MVFNINLDNSKSYHCITCFELCYSFVLNYLGKSNVPLFYRAYYPHEYILNRLRKSDGDYISFDEIGRIHHFGHDLNYMRFKIHQTDYAQMKSLLSSEEKLPFIVRISPNKCPIFDSEKEYVENHLVLLLGIEGEKIYCYDALLDRRFELSESEFENCYDNSFYQLYIPDDARYEIDKESIYAYFEHLKNIRRAKPDKDDTDSIVSPEKELMYYRDAYKITGVLTERMIEYIKYYDLHKDIQDELLGILAKRKKIANKGFVIIEYLKQRKQGLSAQCEKIFEELCQTDEQLSSLLNKDRQLD